MSFAWEDFIALAFVLRVSWKRLIALLHAIEI